MRTLAGTADPDLLLSSRLRVKDGRTIYGKIQSTMGSTIYVKTESGQEVLQASDILSSRTNTPPK